MASPNSLEGRSAWKAVAGKRETSSGESEVCVTAAVRPSQGLAPPKRARAGNHNQRAAGDASPRLPAAGSGESLRESVQHLSKLVTHLAWADDRVLASLRSATTPDASCVELFAHVLASEHVWLARLKGAAPHHPVWPALSLEQCAALVQANQRDLGAYVAALTPDALPRGITYTNSAGQTFTSSIEDILLHLFLHGTYHRGQIAWALRRGGGVPMPTDYIALVRGAPAATRDAGKQPR